MTRRVISSEVLYQGKLRAVRQVVESGSGAKTVQETIEHPGAVVVLPILQDNSGSDDPRAATTIICISQYRHAIKREIIELPAGTIEAGEVPLECAKREIQEEIGYAAREMKPLGCIYPAPGFCDEVQHLFIASDLYPQRLGCDEDEEITVVRLTTFEFEKKVASGEIVDAKSLAIFFKARSMGFI
jgi:ADP-ribose pyrophosphatase